MALHNLVGKDGEECARRYLEAKHYLIRDCNWHSGHRELDIVAEKDGWLVVVEVKTRTSVTYEEPWQAVNLSKIKKIVQAANHYVRRYSIDLPVRFDVLSLIKNRSGWQVEHFEDAFVPPLNN